MTRPPVLPSSMHKPWAGSDSYKISGLNTVHGWTASPVHSSSLPFCVRFNVALRGETPYSHAATLDTGPVAQRLPRRESHPLVNKPFPVRTCIALFRAADRRSPGRAAAILPQPGSRGNHLWKLTIVRRRCQSAWNRLISLVSQEDVHVSSESWELRGSGSATGATEALTPCRPVDLVDGSESWKR